MPKNTDYIPKNTIIVHFLPNFSLSTKYMLINTAGMVAIEIHIKVSKTVVSSPEPLLSGMSTSSPYTTIIAPHHIIINFHVMLKCYSSNRILTLSNPT
mmetsp:Transcript_31157/g.5611  ORF Transcript_31157/g.5611 Transcript_31157/m.5611 type:complete len:98 (-) Transcript_31157:404-697(-)